MYKIQTSLLAFAAVAALAVPAFAGSLTEGTSSSFDAANVLHQLQGKGVDATDVAEWGGEVQATVRLADGHLVTRYFTEDTLRPVGENQASAGRVLTKLDVGGSAATPNSYSLTHVSIDGK